VVAATLIVVEVGKSMKEGAVKVLPGVPIIRIVPVASCVLRMFVRGLPRQFVINVAVAIIFVSVLFTNIVMELVGVRTLPKTTNVLPKSRLLNPDLAVVMFPTVVVPPVAEAELIVLIAGLLVVRLNNVTVFGFVVIRTGIVTRVLPKPKYYAVVNQLPTTPLLL